MANIHDIDGVFICEKCGGDHIFKSVSELRSICDLPRDELVIENAALRLRIEFLEKQLSDNPTRRLKKIVPAKKIDPGQDG